ncbi:MAG: single-stranded DNA-binding protein [Actinobacteria bacterium]|nr:single-stranded DNA-binding protein [Actinomycetota bacterium]MCL5883268.1 single-stranded DNA-binding protein [Actinomycetota bacterium]
MASINRVTLVGNLTRDPELRTTPNGKSVCTLGLAVNERYKNESGEWIEKPNFFDIVVWGAQAESCSQYLAKGRQVAVDGRLSFRSWEAQDGSKRSKVEVIANTVQFLGTRQDAGSSAAPVATGAPSGLNPDTSDFDAPSSSDDDIPF